MTNREVLIHDLSARNYETDLCLVSYLGCPHSSMSECANNKTGNKFGTTEFQLCCDQCKAEWLDKEFEA